MVVELHPEAKAEFQAAARWYDDEEPGAGTDFYEAIERALELVREAPLRWPPWPDLSEGAGIRRYVVPDFPYVLPYVVLNERILVLAVAHTRRNPGYWLDRLDD